VSAPVDETLLVDLDAFQSCYVGAGGDDNVLRLQRLDLAVGRLHLDLAGADDAPGTGKGIDLVLLEQKGDALGVAVDAVALEFHHGGKVELRLAEHDAHFWQRVARFLEPLRRLQQRFGRDAADVETGAAKRRPLLDHRDLHAELRRPDRADIAAGTGADNNEIVCGHD